MIYKSLSREKEALMPVDDGKLSRDHGRHFIITRQLGIDFVTPGAK